MKDLLLQVYSDPKHSAGFSYPQKLYQAVKPYGVTKNQVHHFLAGQNSYTQHKQGYYKYLRRPVTSPTINNLLQADLMVIEKYHRTNSHYKYLLIVIDVLSRFLHIFPLKSKQGKEIAPILDQLFSSLTPKVNYFQTDFGKEFHNKFVDVIMKKHHVKLFSTHSKVGASVAERVIKTIRSRLQKFLTHNKTTKFIHIIQDIVDSYNNTTHSRHSMKPKDVNQANQLQVWHSSFGKFFRKNKKQVRKFKVNDFVRILITKNIFEKGSDKTFSNTIYTVADVINSIPVMYKLRDSHGIVAGSFYNEELIKVNIV